MKKPMETWVFFSALQSFELRQCNSCVPKRNKGVGIESNQIHGCFQPGGVPFDLKDSHGYGP
jgi:hypothetical protein